MKEYKKHWGGQKMWERNTLVTVGYQPSVGVDEGFGENIFGENVFGTK